MADLTRTSARPPLNNGPRRSVARGGLLGGLALCRQLAEPVIDTAGGTHQKCLLPLPTLAAVHVSPLRPLSLQCVGDLPAQAIEQPGRKLGIRSKAKEGVPAIRAAR